MGADEQTASAKEPKIFAALAAVLADVDAVGKGKRNEQQGYKFRSIDDVYNAVHQAFAKHGVFTMLEILNRIDSVRQTKAGGSQFHCICRFRIRFYAQDGSFVDSVLDAEGLDTGDKGTNKAISFAHKYALLTALSIPTEDMAEGDLQRTEFDRGQDNAPPARQASSRRSDPPKSKAPAMPKTNAAPAASQTAPSSEYVIPFGTHKGKKLTDFNPADLEKYVSGIIEAANRPGAPQLSPQQQEMVSKIMTHLGSELDGALSPPTDFERFQA